MIEIERNILSLGDREWRVASENPTQPLHDRGRAVPDFGVARG
jgi:hypothetical protein